MAFPSTFVDIQQQVIKNLRLDGTADLSMVKDAINSAYTEAVVETEANVTFSTTTLTSGTATYTLPSSISRIKSVFPTPVGGQANRPLKRITLDQLIAYRSAASSPSASQGSVWAYCILGLTEFELYPTPQAADVLTIYYSARPTALSADADVPILPEPYATDCLAYGASAQMSEFSGDPLLSWYQQKSDDAKARLRSHLNRLTGRVSGQFNVQDESIWPPHDPSTDIR